MKVVTRYSFPLLAAFLIIFYFFSRLFHLSVIPVFVDEAIYTRWSQVILSDQNSWFIPLSDGKQPLFMWLGTIPQRYIQDPLVAERLISVWAGFLSLIGIWLLTRELFNQRIAFFALLLYILCPFSMMYDRLAVPDGLLTTFFVFTALTSVYLIKTLRGDFAFLLGWILGGGLLTKSTAVIAALLVPFSLLFCSFRKHQLIRLFGLWAMALFSGFLLYNILHLSPLFYLIGQRTPDFIFTPKEVLTHPIDPFLFRFKDVTAWLWGYMTGPIFLLCVVGIPVAIWKGWREGTFLLAWFLLPLLTEMEIAKGFTPRYFIFVTPFLLIFGAYLINLAWEKFQQPRSWILVLLFIPALVFEYFLLTNPEKAAIPEKEKEGYLEAWSAGYGLVEVSNYLKDIAKTNQPVTVITEGTQGYGTLPDGLQIYLKGLKNVSVAGVDKGEIAQVPANLISDSKTHQAFLVVNQSRFFDKANTHLKLIAQYPKANGENPMMFYQIRP